MKTFKEFIYEKNIISIDKPNEYGYIYFKTWASENIDRLKNDINKSNNTAKTWDTITHWWMEWVRDSGNNQWGYITDNQKFGKELALMMWKDDFIFDRQSNRITKLK
jgi:hypothetical protein